MIVKKMGVGYDNGRYALNSYKTIISGTATGLRISSVNGTAFLDNCPADIIAAAGTGAIVNIYDASSRLISGLPDSVGSSEGLGSEKLTSWTNNRSYPYETFTVSGTDITSAINSSGFGIAYQSNAITIFGGALYKNTNTYTLNSGSFPFFGIGYSNLAIFIHFTLSGTSITYSTLTNEVANDIVLRTENGVATNFSLTNNTVKQVTAPSSSGVIIKDLSGNQNFISKDALFTYNAASYTYKIWN
jgi:hypothetical protein